MTVASAAATTITPTDAKFVLFGALHLAIIAFTFLIPAALSVLTRRSARPHVERILAVIMATILVLDRVVNLSLALHDGRVLHWAEALPMHLCDWATIVVISALLRGGQLTYELAYFWGLSGTVQAILTPDVAENFPTPISSASSCRTAASSSRCCS